MAFWIVAGLAAFILGLSKGGMPVVSILAVPLLALFMDPALAAGLLLPLYLVADSYAVYLFRKAFSVRNLKILLPAAFVGVLLGYFAVSLVPGDAVKLLLAAIGFSYLASCSAATVLQARFPGPQGRCAARSVLGLLGRSHQLSCPFRRAAFSGLCIATAA
jgi:uncharacterized membrane protein YfcA